MKNFIKWTFVGGLCLFLSLQCNNDNPVDEHEHGEHAEAVGLVIFANNSEWVRYQNGVVTGKITVRVGQETPLLSIQFINEHDGKLFTPEGDHHALAWTIADKAIADVRQNPGDNKWAIYVIGKTVGNTSIEIKIMHGDHADFVSLPIPIEVIS